MIQPLVVKFRPASMSSVPYADPQCSPLYYLHLQTKNPCEIVGQSDPAKLSQVFWRADAIKLRSWKIYTYLSGKYNELNSDSYIRLARWISWWFLKLHWNMPWELPVRYVRKISGFPTRKLPGETPKSVLERSSRINLLQYFLQWSQYKMWTTQCNL